MLLDVSKNRSAFTFPEDMNFQEITTPTDQRSEYSVLCLIPTILRNLILLSMARYIPIPLQARTGPQGFRRFRLPGFSDNRHMNVAKVVSLKLRLPLTLEEDPWYSFLLEAESVPGP
jgi:hypothetical protein